MRHTVLLDDAPEITVLQLPKFRAEANALLGVDGLRRWRFI
jgi:hypothetical protein